LQSQAQIELSASQSRTKIGFGGHIGIGVINPGDVNRCIDSIEDIWLEGKELIYSEGTHAVKLGLEASGHLSLVLSETDKMDIELQPEISVFFAPKLVELETEYTSYGYLTYSYTGYDFLDVYLWAYNPGISLYLIPKTGKDPFQVKFRLGGGIFYSIAHCDISGDIDSDISLKGSGLGYHATAGVAGLLFSHLELSASLSYRMAKIGDLEGNGGYGINEIDLSGIIFRVGGSLYF